MASSKTTATTKPASVAEYLASVPPPARRALRQIRTAIRKAAPGLTERLSYRIPTFDLDGKYVLYMAAFKDHVSIYPVTKTMVAKYGKQIAPYRSGAGTLRFALDTPLPLALITRLAELRVKERGEEQKTRTRRPAPRR